MPVPTYVVEISFSSSGFVDVSQYVQSISLGRGISRVLEDYSAGSLSITFVNNARVFDPLNTSSPLWYGAGGYTLVQPGGQVRVTANGVRRFTGFIQDWEFSYDNAGFDGKATLIALDRLYRVGNANLTGGTAWLVESTSDRMKTVFNYNNFGAAEYAGIESTHTLLGYDEFQPGDSILSYLQQVARSEPGDLFSNASGVMVFKDRSFTNYTWSNTLRQNLIKYPNALSVDTTSPSVTGGTGLGDGWVYGWRPITTITPYYAGGTVNRAEVVGGASRDFWYQEVNQQKMNPAGTAVNYVFSTWLRGVGLTGAGVTGAFVLLDSVGNSLDSISMNISAASSATWVNMVGTANYSGTGVVAGFYVNVSAPGTALSYDFFGNGWQVEQGTANINYFDGAYNPYVSSAGTVYEVAWAGAPYASQSGLLTSTASTVAASTVYTFADVNSQSSVSGTGIPFTELQVMYGSENLYNQVQVLGVNATAIKNDSTGQSRYGLRTYSQTDNLTTSITKPNDIAAGLLAEWRLPEYRAEQITVALESLSSTQQNIVLGIELRNVVRVLFKPSNTGSIVDKYYQVLGILGNTDVERDSITFTLGSLDNLAIRLDSTLLAVLDTDTLG